LGWFVKINHYIATKYTIKLSIAKQMRLGVIVEGVETKEQRAFYEKEKGCVLQGYFLAKPMPIEALEEWLKNHV